MLPEHQGARCDRAHRLRRRQPDLGAQGLRRGRRADLFTPDAARRPRARRAASSCRASATSARRRRSTGAWTTRSARRVARAACRCSASASACSGCSRAATKRRESRGLGADRRTLLAAAAAERAEGAARRLELARASSGRRGCSTGIEPGAQVYFTHSYRRAGHAAKRSRPRDARRAFAAAVETRSRLRRAVPSREVRRRAASGSCATSSASRGLTHALQTPHRLPRRPQRLRRQGRATSKACATPAIRRRWRAATTSKASTSSSILDVTATLEARRALARHDPRGLARAVHSADGRRRDPHRSRRGGGDRCRRGQGQREQRGAGRSRADHHGSRHATAARRSSSPSTPSAHGGTLRGLRAQRQHVDRRATPSSGRGRPRRAAPARSC